jgi:hypothetical protein
MVDLVDQARARRRRGRTAAKDVPLLAGALSTQD